MLIRQGTFVLFAFLGLLIGCALSPQHIIPTPILTADFPIVGHGQAINVKIIDGRSSNILGTRGGLYANTSNVTVNSEDVLPKLQAQAEHALTTMGYQLNSNANNRLIITLAELTYRAPDSSRKIDVSATFRSELTTGSKGYKGRYSASKHQEFTSAPNITENTQLVSDVLKDALTRLLKDTHLAGAL